MASTQAPRREGRDSQPAAATAAAIPKEST